eukprot:1215291-Rhodomonas_salina.2
MRGSKENPTPNGSCCLENGTHFLGTSRELTSRRVPSWRWSADNGRSSSPEAFNRTRIARVAPALCAHDCAWSDVKL